MVTKRRSAVDGVFATTTDLINYSGTWNTNDTVVTDGFTTVGDGGGAKWKLTGNTITASQTPALTGNATLSDANGNEFSLHIDNAEIRIKQLGAAIDGSTDDLAVINAAIAGIDAGDIILGAGTIALSDTLVNDKSNIRLFGVGRGEITNSKLESRNSIGTRLLWTGAPGGTVVRYTTDNANSGTNVKRSGGGIFNVGIDGNESAATALDIDSWEAGEFKLLTCYCTDYHWKIDVLTNGTASSPADSQNNKIDIISHDVNTSNEANTLGIVHGDGVANASLNTFEMLTLTAESAAIALELGDADGNTFEFVRAGTRAAAVGNGGKIILHADDTMTTVAQTGGFCRYNVFEFIQATKGIVSKKTIAGSDSATDNTVVVLSGGNGSPFPTIENGSSLDVGYYNGTTELSRVATFPTATLHRVTSNNNATLGKNKFSANNSAGEKISYADVAGRIVDNTDGSEDGQLDFSTYQAGALTRTGFTWKGWAIGAPTGGDKGAGTLNVQNGIYSNNIPWLSGAGSPEGAVSAPVGSMYSRTDGGAGTTFYVKESGAGNTGWIAK